jgi:hypothetical protein
MKMLEFQKTLFPYVSYKTPYVSHKISSKFQVYFPLKWLKMADDPNIYTV